ncbi:MAG TPA: EamA family transporter [Nocardioides sp.]|nr:EamA family transporter [Nocardioides sp.]
MATRSSLARGALAMSFVGSSVGVSDALVDAPLFAAQGLRYAAAAVLLLAVARLAGVRVLAPTGAEWLWLTGVAATGLVLFNVAVVRGVEHAEPAVIAVAVAGAPVVIGLLGPVMERRAPRAQLLVAAGVVTVGSVLVEGTGATDAAGVGWAAVALACEAGFTLLALPVLPRHGAWGVSVHTVWIATVLLAVLSLTTEGHDAASRLERDDLLAVGYLAIVVTTVAFALWYSTVAQLGSGRAALLCGVAPVAAAAVGIATTGHWPRLLVWVGLAVIAGGLAVGLRGSDDRSRDDRRERDLVLEPAP